MLARLFTVTRRFQIFGNSEGVSARVKAWYHNGIAKHVETRGDDMDACFPILGKACDPVCVEQIFGSAPITMSASGAGDFGGDVPVYHET